MEQDQSGNKKSDKSRGNGIATGQKKEPDGALSPIQFARTGSSTAEQAHQTRRAIK